MFKEMILYHGSYRRDLKGNEYIRPECIWTSGDGNGCGHWGESDGNGTNHFSQLISEMQYIYENIISSKI